jgi:nucleoside-diphosphate-sugar epimerase
MVKALVTGAGGFLGRYVVEQLVARGDQVRCLARGDYPELKILGAETIRGDIRDGDSVMRACESIDVVFHTAAVAGVWGPWEYFYSINTRGTENVIAACRARSISALVYTSSPSVTFDGSDQRGVNESAPYPSRWLCHYPHTKAVAEQQVLAADDPGGLRTCALRPHLIWGPRDRHLIPRLLQRARSGRLRQVGDGSNLIDMVYVDNAAQAHLQAADALLSSAAPAGKAYFISQGQPVNCWQWINQILELAGIPAVHKKISFQAAWRLGALLETAYRLARVRSEPPMTRFLAAQLATDHYFDITAARDDFGYSPCISLEEGMRRLGKEIAPG